MTDTAASKPSARNAWAEADYTSAIPDFKGAPEIMFHAAAGWKHPDPAWQAANQGWAPKSGEIPVAGQPVYLARWAYWVPKVDAKREARRARAKRVVRYALFAVLYPIGFTAVISGILLVLFLPAGLFAILLGSPVAVAGALALFIAMIPMLLSMDFMYLASIRRGARGAALFRRTFIPALVLDLVITFGLSLATYFVINLYPDGDALAVFSAAVAMGSLLATIPLLVIYALRELQLKGS